MLRDEILFYLVSPTDDNQPTEGETNNGEDILGKQGEKDNLVVEVEKDIDSSNLKQIIATSKASC